jgi:hypothetical protein
MRKTVLALSFFLLALASIAAWAGPPTAVGVWFDHTVKYKFTNCSATGSAVQVVPNGKYVIRVMDEDVNLVYGTTYDGGATNNTPWPKGSAWIESFYADDGGTPLSCQSTGATGDVNLDGTH